MNKRPIIILLLAIILLLVGILIIFFAGKLFSSSSWEFNSLIIVTGVFYISTGVGLLLRRKWGWWLGVLLSIYGIAGFFDNFALLDAYDYDTGASILTFSQISKDLIESLIYLGLTLYFFRRKTLTYYDIVKISKRKFAIGLSIVFIIKVMFYYI